MKPRTRPTLARKLASSTVALLVLGIVAVVNQPMVAAASAAYHQFAINRQSYKQESGHWSRLPVPQDFKVNAIHAALLNTGKLLIIAGSGNNRDAFEAGTFRTIIYDPATDKFKDVPTPSDVFCAGHTFLPNGNLLVAGGTADYEVLPEDIEHAYGVMKVKNESPTSGPHKFAKGTRIVSTSGHVYQTRDDVTLGKATTMRHGELVMTHAAEVEVFVDAVETGNAPVVEQPAQYTVEGLTGLDRQNIYGVSDKITREKQEYAGDNKSYEFDPRTESYVKVGDMVEHRWYPTLAELPSGDVLAVSGLDQFGRIIPGNNERYLAEQKEWVDAPELHRTFPTYPSFHMLADGNLFYSGSNAGYGSDTVGRTPGIWDVRKNTFKEVPGLRDPKLTETSSSVLLPPAQDQRVMIFGGGGVGESEVSTKRTDIIDLSEKKPRYRPGPDLPEPARYLNAVVLPDDTVFTTGGSSGYRGGKYGDKTRSDLFNAQIYQPASNTFTTAAESTVGRNYHSEAILLPDGRVVTMGSDPLYDESGKGPGTFEKRIEVYSPPYLFQGLRPSITGGPEQVKRGTTVDFTSPDAARVTKARLVRPSAVTHVLDVDQRSVALDITPKGGDTLGLSIPKTRGIAPSGWYMLFLLDGNGVPSVARWVQVL
ncbi:galactose oxidase early set domain-containing protein [Actinoplanes sp. TFC3]|uniref:galactose oxidase early set domain-containing protein n=1 Tax=Actinoplanes sp. TFC3 TaxID=1710355 RepID=UPI00082A295D|nr:galactose oxidase early set domain-containing protein [Actinoplanes sp. TFC3]